MITYDNDGVYFLANLFKLQGSVFPKALRISLPSASASVVFVYLVHTQAALESFRAGDNVMSNNAIWGGFSFAVGFLVIFRTSQAYSRFWEGCTNMHRMGAEWYDACAALIAFTKYSNKSITEVMKFQNILVRLFSMLHSSACGEIEESGMGYEHINTRMGAFDMELIDAQSFSDDCLLSVQNSDAKTEMIMQWIQQFIVANIKTQILSIPPPLLSRSFQELGTGLVHFKEAMKIANVPFPFPYAQTCDMLLVLHWFVVPFVISQWVLKPWWAGVFAFIMVFTLWTLNFIAIELENPFGCDNNDIDGSRLQRDMNNHLRVLVREETWRVPVLRSESKSAEQELQEQHQLRARAAACDGSSSDSFTQLWKSLHSRGSQITNVPSLNHVPVSRFRAAVRPGVNGRMSAAMKDKKGHWLRSASGFSERMSADSKASGQDLQLKKECRGPEIQALGSLGSLGPTRSIGNGVQDTAVSATALKMLESEAADAKADQDAKSAFATSLLEHQSCWDAHLTPRCLDTVDTRVLSQEVPALLPRVLAQNTAFTPPGRGQPGFKIIDGGKPLTQRSILSDSSGGSTRPPLSYRLSQRSAENSARSLRPASPKGKGSKGGGKGDKWRDETRVLPLPELGKGGRPDARKDDWLASRPRSIVLYDPQKYRPSSSSPERLDV